MPARDNASWRHPPPERNLLLMSAVLQIRPPASLAEFLEWERCQAVRYEWDGVQPVAMVGGSFAHTELASRLSDVLRPALRGGPCTVVRADLKGTRPSGGPAPATRTWRSPVRRSVPPTRSFRSHCSSSR